MTRSNPVYMNCYSTGKPRSQPCSSREGELTGSVTELPPKIPYYATLFVLANARKQVIGKDILDFTVEKTKELCEAGDLVRAKLMMRFLAGLAKIVEQNGVMVIVDELVAHIENKQPNVPIQPRITGLIGVKADR